MKTVTRGRRKEEEEPAKYVSKVYQRNSNFPLPNFELRRPQKETSSYSAI